MTKKDLKKLKVTMYTNTVHIYLSWLNCRNFMVNCALLGLVFFLFCYLSEDKSYLNDSCWFMGIVFILKKRELGNLTASQENVGIIKC